MSEHQPTDQLHVRSPGRGPSPPDQAGGDPKRWVALGVILVAAFMDFLDAGIVVLAAPVIQVGLGAGPSAVQWFVAAYTLSLALVLLTGGRLGDRLGRKRMFMIGMAGFTAASALCGLAMSPEALIAARALQGASGGLMMPQILATIQITFSPRERPKAFSFYGLAAGIANVSGPLIAGTLLKMNIAELSWRLIFLINIPVGLICLVVAYYTVQESRGEGHRRLDLLGAGVVTLALLALIYPLVQGGDAGWPLWMTVLMATSLPLFAVFVLTQHRREKSGHQPLVPLGLFHTRAFNFGLFMVLAFFAGIAAFFFVFVLYMSQGLGYSPMYIGVSFLSWPIGVLLASGIAFQKSEQSGRAILVSGSTLLSVCMIGLFFVVAFFADPVTGWHLTPILLFGGVGLGLVAPTLINIILAGVPNKDVGAASGVLNTVQQVAAAMGVAILGAVFFHVLFSGDQPDYQNAIEFTLLVQTSVFFACVVLSFFLPKRARPHEEIPMSG